MDVENAIAEFLKDVREVFASKKAISIYIYDSDLETIRDLISKGYRLGSVQGSGSGIRALASKSVQTGEFEISCTVYSENITMERYLQLRKSIKE